jgi:hypothetical protein
VIGEPFRGVVPVADLSFAERVSAALSADALGVRGVIEPPTEDAADDGRVTDDAADALLVLRSLAGRVGELLFPDGLLCLDLLDGVDGVAGGVALTTIEFFNAAR